MPFLLLSNLQSQMSDSTPTTSSGEPDSPLAFFEPSTKADLLKAIVLHPNDALAYHRLAMILPPGGEIVLPSGGKFTKRSLLLRVVDLKPSFAVAYYNLACTLEKPTARITLLNGTVMDKKTLLMKAIDADPTMVAAWNNLATTIQPGGRVTLLNGEEFTQKALLLKAIDINPNYAECILNLAYSMGAPTVTLLSGTTLTELELYMLALDIDPMRLKTLSSQLLFPWLLQRGEDGAKENFDASKRFSHLYLAVASLPLSPHPPTRTQHEEKMLEAVNQAGRTNNVWTSLCFPDATITDHKFKIFCQAFASHQRLTELDVTLNQISLTRFFPSNFPKLTRLVLKHNQIETVEPLLQISTLTHLDLRHAVVYSHPWAFLTFLSNSSNQISKIPLIGESWKDLSWLSLERNRLASIARLLSLTKLAHLDISNNAITAIPTTFADRTQLQTLICFPNPFDPPIGVSQQGMGDIETLLRQELRATRKAWRQVKLILTGKSGVGKTRLALWLAGLDSSDPKPTDGISFHHLLPVYSTDSTLVKYSLLDMSGNDVHDATHRIFTTGKAVYVIVFKITEIDEADIESRIKLAKSAGVQEVILVGTHTDLLKGDHQPELKARLFDRFGALVRIQGVFFLTSTPGYFDFWWRGGLTAFRTGLAEIGARSPLLYQALPIYYFEVADMVANIPKPFWVVTREKFVDSFLRHYAVSTEAIDTLLEFFSEAGLVVWHNAPKSRDWVVLDPQWFSALLTAVVSANKPWPDGVVSKDQLTVAWKWYPFDQHETFVRLLQDFEILTPINEISWKVAIPVTKAASSGPSGSAAASLPPPSAADLTGPTTPTSGVTLGAAAAPGVQPSPEPRVTEIPATDSPASNSS